MKVEMVLDEKEEKGKGANTYAPKSQIATNKFMREQIQFFKISFIDVVIYFDIIVVGWTHDHKMNMVFIAPKMN